MLIGISCSTNTTHASLSSKYVSQNHSSILSLEGSIASATLDEQDRRVMEKLSPRTLDRMDRNEPLTINDVIKLSQGGVSDDAIIRYMKESQSGYQLTQMQVRRLQDAGVSQRVINIMTNTQ